MTKKSQTVEEIKAEILVTEKRVEAARVRIQALIEDKDKVGFACDSNKHSTFCEIKEEAEAALDAMHELYTAQLRLKLAEKGAL